MRGNKIKTSPKSDQHFFLAMAIWFIAISILGFGMQTTLRVVTPGELQPMSYIMMLHGVTFTSWILLFLAQVLLIRRKDHSTHRKLGRWSLALIVLILLTGFAVVLESYGANRSPPFMAFLNLSQIGSGVALLLIGRSQRSHPFRHKRLMLGGAGMLAIAAAARAVRFLGLETIPFFAPVVIALPFIALMIHDTLVYRRPSLALLMLGWCVLLNFTPFPKVIVDQLEGKGIMPRFLDALSVIV